LIITFSYFLKKISTTSCFEGNSILYNFMSHKNVQKMLHLRGMAQNITGPFQSQQKVNFLFWGILKECTKRDTSKNQIFCKWACFFFIQTYSSCNKECPSPMPRIFDLFFYLICNLFI